MAYLPPIFSNNRLFPTTYFEELFWSQGSFFLLGEPGSGIFAGYGEDYEFD
jgi:hypothetical protein